MMNTVNVSTRFLAFQLKMGRSPRLIPLSMLVDLPEVLKGTPEVLITETVLNTVTTNVGDTKDNFLAAKVPQVHSASNSRGKKVVYELGDWVMLSTLNGRAAKFMPRWDGPYKVDKTHHETSNYRLILPNNPGTFAKTCCFR